MPSSKRDNAHYLARLQKVDPLVHGRYLAGEFASVRQALLAAEVRKPTSRLNELKQKWKIASDKDHRDFLGWLRTRYPRIVAKPARLIIDSDGFLAPAYVGHIHAILARHRMMPADIKKDAGFSTFDWRFASALRRTSRPPEEVVLALETWLREWEAK